jgi:hypothetical protein
MMDFVSYRTEQGVKVALVSSGRTKVRVLMMDSPLTVRSLPMSETRYMAPLLRKGAPYPRMRAINKFRAFAKVHGATKSAKAMLAEAAAAARATATGSTTSAGERP